MNNYPSKNSNSEIIFIWHDKVFHRMSDFTQLPGIMKSNKWEEKCKLKLLEEAIKEDDKYFIERIFF